MRRKRNFGLSRLKMAWLTLFILVLGGAIFVWLTPVIVKDPDLVIDLPAEPERYAAAPIGEVSSTPDLLNGESGSEDSIIEGADEGELSADARLTTEEEELPDGTLKITIPNSSTSESARPIVMATSALPALVGKSEYGPLPKIGGDGATPFHAYRRPMPRSRKPQVAIMLSGLGLDPVLSAEAIDRLPPEVSLSFAPYSKDVAALMAKAMAAGHEVAIELPMEEPGVSAEALGPAGLTVSRRGDANARRLEWLLARSPAYPMVTNYLGSSFGQDNAAMAQIMETLKIHGLGYIDDTGFGAEAAVQFGVPYGRVNVVVPRGSGLAEQGLSQLKSAASEGRPVLARLYISAEAITAIGTWTEGLNESGFDLVPASAVARQ